MRQNAYPISETNGLRIFLQNKSYPQPDVFGSSFSLESGKETNIIIEKTFVSKTPAPYTSCTDLTNSFDSDLYNFIASKNRIYRQNDCLNAGYQQEIQKSKFYNFYLLRREYLVLNKTLK